MECDTPGSVTPPTHVDTRANVCSCRCSGHGRPGPDLESSLQDWRSVVKKFMLFVVLLAVLILVAHNTKACADDLAMDALIIGAGQGADVGSTYYALHRCPGCYEGGLLGSANRVAVGKVVFSGATLLLCREMRKHGHKREARWVAIGVAVVGGALAAHNMRQPRR